MISAVLLLFQAIGKMMNEDYDSEMMSIVDVVEAKYLSWIDGIGVDFAQQAAQYVINMPMYLLFVALGILFFYLACFIRGDNLLLPA